MADDEEYRILLDLNVLYSGQITSNVMNEFAFLGAAAGGLGGYANQRTVVSTGAGILAGAALGAIIGSHVREDTFITIGELTLATANGSDTGKTKSVAFGGAKASNESTAGFRRFDETISTRMAVYAGGRNIRQSRISDMVRTRIIQVAGSAI